MGWWQVNADTLAGSRFVHLPAGRDHREPDGPGTGNGRAPGRARLADAHLPAYRERLAGDPVTALLVRAALGARWIADFLTPTPPADGEDGVRGGAGADPGDAGRGRARGPDRVARRPAAAPLHRADLPERAADLLEWVWAETVLPYWPRRRRDPRGRRRRPYRRS